jgi:hypothetical protein
MLGPIRANKWRIHCGPAGESTTSSELNSKSLCYNGSWPHDPLHSGLAYPRPWAGPATAERGGGGGGARRSGGWRNTAVGAPPRCGVAVVGGAELGATMAITGGRRRSRGGSRPMVVDSEVTRWDRGGTASPAGGRHRRRRRRRNQSRWAVGPTVPRDALRVGLRARPHVWPIVQ